MTCVIGLIQANKIYMGADSAGVADYDVAIRNDSKVFIRGPMIFGFTESFRMGQLLKYTLEIPKHPKGLDNHAYLVTLFIDAVRAAMKKGGFAKKKDEEESGGSFLLGYRGKLYHIEEDYQVGERAENFDSCGCGSDIALGAMYVNREEDPKARITKALDAAVHYNAGIRPPFIIEEISFKRGKKNA